MPNQNGGPNQNGERESRDADREELALPNDQGREIDSTIEEEPIHDTELDENEDSNEQVEDTSSSPSQNLAQIQDIVLKHIRGPKYRPVKAKALARQLHLPLDSHRMLRRAIRRLVRAGRAAFGPNHAVMPVAAKAPSAGVENQPIEDSKKRKGSSDLVSGSFKRTSAGSGFVRLATAIRGDRSGDIYIHSSKTLDAADGDTVKVRLQRPRPGEQNRAGEVVEVVSRSKRRFVGVYRREGTADLVQIDGRAMPQPILVGDPGSRSVRQGDKVVIEMVRFPSARRPGEGVIVEVLGNRSQHGVDTLSIIHEFDLPREFPDDVLEDSRAQADAFDESIADRTDFTTDTVITIDPVDARDFDDAISLTTLENGGWRLGVHIADVSHFVRPKSALDREAQHRATSVYLPDRVIPMLPEVISNHLASLQPDRVRYTLTAIMEFDSDGRRLSSEFVSGAIKSCRRFAYEEVDDFIAHPEVWKAKLEPRVYRLLGDMRSLAAVLRRRRMERGSIELTLPETKIDFDADGKVSGAHLVENTESHRIIEEFMLSANEAVADFLSQAGWLFLRRIHDHPDPRRLESLTWFVRELGVPCESLESRFEIRRVVAHVAGGPLERAIHFAVLRSMQKAIYSPDEVGHYALSSENYCHFTSPIRRYPDLTVHRTIKAIIAGRKPTGDFERLIELGDHCSEREQRAERAERELVKLKLFDYVRAHPQIRLEAIITGVEHYGVFAQGLKIPVEGLIPIENLPEDRYRHDEISRTLSGKRAGNQFRLGDVVYVDVASVDVDRRELIFVHAGRAAAGSPAPLPPWEKNAPVVEAESPFDSKFQRKKGAKKQSAKANRKHSNDKSPRGKKPARPKKKLTQRVKKKKSRPGKRERAKKKRKGSS